MSEPTQPPAPSASPKELTGQIGKYAILRQLGKGAMGVVYLAHDTVLERDVALKVMAASIADDPDLKRRFEREARAVAKLTHPSIVMVFDLGSHTDGSPFIAMELLKGQDLSRAMRQGPMSLDRIVAIVAQVLAGLNQAHQAGIVHRDIKPGNIFVNDDGAVKIMDFGVARLTTASMTGTGHVVGTADYMSPEQVKGAKVDGRSDLFSVGSLFYELLTGRKPFHADNLMAIFYRITHEEPDYSLIPAEPAYEPLLPILKRALAKELDQRYRTAFEFMADLREYLRTNAAGAVVHHELEGLLDVEAPPTPPPPLTGPGTHPPTGFSQATEVMAGTMDLESTTPAPRAGTGRTLRAPAARRGPPVVPTVVGSPRRTAPTAPGRSPWGFIVGALTLLVVAAGVGYVIATRPVAPVAQVQPAPTAEAVTPVPTAIPATPAPTAAPPPPTPAPAPTFAPPAGRGAEAMRAAQAAFGRGDYDTALAQAQRVLGEDPNHADAKKMAEQALNGQRAEMRFRAAETALGRGDFAQAQSDADAGRALAPWDRRGTDLIARAQELQRRAAEQARQSQQSQKAAEIAALLEQADAALTAQRYDAAIAHYEEVLKRDPQNERAGVGKTGAIVARSSARAAASSGPRTAAPAAKSFESGKTVAQSGETRAAGAVPEGFEESPNVAVRRGTQSAQLPGKILFEVRPDPVRPGDTYTVTVSFQNEGNASIPLKEMTVNTVVNGRRAGGVVPLSVSEVAPRQKAVLLSQSDSWRESYSAWAMEVTVRTTRGETYRNQVSWR